MTINIDPNITLYQSTVICLFKICLDTTAPNVTPDKNIDKGIAIIKTDSDFHTLFSLPVIAI